MLLLKITAFFTVFVLIEAHVRLTFPPGRTYSLDFLDNQRTYKSCGGMRSGNIKTSLAAGKSYQVSWHMGLLHQGNFQIELFNLTGKVMDFISWKSAPIITQSQWIEIPQNLTCINCTIRLLREAKEFSVEGNPYIFWSCADVDIVAANCASEAPNQCSGHGRPSSGNCSCNEGFTGKYCELPTECFNDSHCGKHGRGKCVKLTKIDEYAIGQCFCEFPYFGENCSKKMQNGAQTIEKFKVELKRNLRTYRKIELSGDQVTLYYKAINNSGTERQVEFVLESKSTSFLGLGWRPAGLTRECKRHWPKTGQTVRKRRGLEDDFKAEAAGFQKKFGHLTQPSNNLKTHEFEHVRFSAMDCTDMMIASVLGNVSRIRDYYTMDRSTPQPDAFWGGVDNIIFATGWESNTTTTVVFRKSIASSDIDTDHNLSGDLHLIWSRGQTFTPDFDSSYRQFYAQDEIKYHGYGPNQRGVLKVRLVNI